MSSKSPSFIRLGLFAISLLVLFQKSEFSDNRQLFHVPLSSIDDAHDNQYEHQKVEDLDDEIPACHENNIKHIVNEIQSCNYQEKQKLLICMETCKWIVL